MRRAVSTVVALLLSVAAVLLGATGAMAANEAVGGRVLDPAKSGGLPGVSVTVTGPNAFTQKIVTDASGKFEVPVPGPGTYQVSLDAATLPAGISLADPSRNPLSVDILTDAKRSVLFPTVEGAPGKPTGDGSGITWARVAQLTLDGLVLGLVLALAGVGLSLIYGTTGLTNFAQGELITIGALAAYVLNNTFKIPFVLAAALAVVIGALLGGAQDIGVWRRLRKRNTGLVAMLVISIGLGIFIRYVLLFLFGGGVLQYADYAGQAGLQIGPFSITPKSLIGSLIAIALILATAYWLLRTRMGKATRAVSDNPALAAASGIDVEKVINRVWVYGAGLAAFSGILLGMNQGIRWDMGVQILLLVFASVTVGGLGTAFGALAGGMLVGLVIQLSTLWVPPELKTVGALVILIVVLLVRPQGLLGRRERVG